MGVDVPRVVAAALAPPARERLWRDSLRALADGEVQQSLARIPLVRRWFQWLPEPAKQAVRARLRRGEPVRRRGSPERRFSSDHPFIAGQKRTVAHSSEKASRLLGYTAPVSYDEGMRLTETWLRQTQILDVLVARSTSEDRDPSSGTGS